MDCPCCHKRAERRRFPYQAEAGWICATVTCANYLKLIAEYETPVVSKLEGKFEPEAKDCRDPMTAAATSIAVSLKRIADALEPTNPSVMDSIPEALQGIVKDEELNEKVDELRDTIHDEVVYAKIHQSTSIPFGLIECKTVSNLLRELGEIAMAAPGGHQHLIDEAHAWASALDAENPR